MSSEVIYQVGDTRNVDVEFRDPYSNELIDPTTVHLIVKGPSDPGPVTYVYGSGDGVVTRISVGKYRGAIDCTEPGKWQYAMGSPGPVGKGFEPARFDVLPLFSSR